MKNKLWIILVIFIIIGIGVGIYLFTKNNNSNKSNYSTQKTAISNQSNLGNTPPQVSNENKPKTEELLSSFSTKIYTKDSSRQTNINITCSTLNNTIIANGSTFSFCDTVGQATSDKGYQEADIYDNEGNKKKGLGGGNCQVSTTLYNAVLKVPNLVVTEKHEHSNKVPYIEEGKDAAVAYGGYDLKFKNETGFDIKIKSEATSDNITITLFKLI